MKIITTGLLSGILCLYSSVFAQPSFRSYASDSDLGARERQVDMIFLRLDVSFQPMEGKVSGTVVHVFELLRDRVDTLFLDGPGIKVKSLTLNGEKTPFEINPQGITIKFLKPLIRKDGKTKTGKSFVMRDSIRIDYEAAPSKGLYFTGWYAELLKFKPLAKNFCEARKQIWTQGQGIDNRHWIPMHDDMDDKVVSALTIHFDKQYQVLSNGNLISIKDGKDGKTKAWEFTMSKPHAPYLIMLAIGKYEVKSEKSGSGVPMHYWYYPEYPERIEPTFRYSKEMMDFLENETGVQYPWESYAQVPVQDFIYGAMENTTATIFGDFSMVDSRAFNDRNYIGTNAHELTHQWFGDFVTAHSNSHVWLQESFATHYAKHFKRKVLGEDVFQWERRGEMNAALAASKSDRLPIVHSRAGGSRAYSKGSLVLDMLRTVVGEDAYKRGLFCYLKRHGYRNVDTHDFYRAFMDTLGINLDWFFEEWLYKGGEPNYSVSWENMVSDPQQVSTPAGQTIFTYGGQYTRIQVQQVQTQDEFTGLFKMPIEIKVYYKDGNLETKSIWIENRQTTIDIKNPLGKPIDFVLFDPGCKILKTLSFPKTIQELRSQALKAPDMIDRYDALMAMRDSSIEIKRRILEEIYNKNSFFVVRSEVLSQLSKDSSEIAKAVFKMAFKDADIQVRKAAINQIYLVGLEMIPILTSALRDSSYEMAETALVKLFDRFPERKAEWLSFTENQYGTGNRLRVKWLELNQQTEHPSGLQELIEMSGNGYEFRTRVHAMEAIQRINYFDQTVLTNLVDAILSNNSRLSGPARESMDFFYAQNVRREFIRKNLSKLQLSEGKRQKLKSWLP